MCKHTAPQPSDQLSFCCNYFCRRCLAEWAIYFHLHLAESMVAQQGGGQTSEGAAQHVTAAAGLAATHNMLQQQVGVTCMLVVLGSSDSVLMVVEMCV